MLRRTALKRSLVVLAVTAVVTLLAPSTAGAGTSSKAPTVSPLATFGSGLGSGSAIGPDGALYVTDGNAGKVWRIDRRTGAVSQYASGLPVQVIGIGGAMDIAFIGRTAYVLVTLVGGDIVGGPHIGDATVGIYRLERNGRFSVIADIGAWSASHPPATDYFVTTGVQYALQTYQGGFLVTDGHHNRVLCVSVRGDITAAIAFANVVPTGLESLGGKVYVSQAGPVPHAPATGKALVFRPGSGTARELARGASLVVDVEFGPGHQLYALSQGQWDGVAEGTPALPDTGRLVKVGQDGRFKPVTDGSGREIVLDRPTSLEFVGNDAYVVSLTGQVVKITNVSPRH